MTTAGRIMPKASNAWQSLQLGAFRQIQDRVLLGKLIRMLHSLEFRHKLFQTFDRSALEY